MPAAPSPATTLTRIGESVRATRRAMHLTQQELADLAGVSDATVRQIERATGRGTLSSLLAVLGVLGLDLEVHGR
ncbi:helix-turn-helix transcriptional regulator [Micrococcus sp.]|uniref:helix-turn-helix transcriptional regulator n=1 Tax=Micrococcus sp. TaxID=1271 RepID=UPI002A90A203|nr:helix-turn-helix transcriptional regulator [Micrococcus sp.]MDY6054761.1 helix-turn-helix transcriptional regulator [Micrococcus sp.]